MFAKLLQAAAITSILYLIMGMDQLPSAQVSTTSLEPTSNRAEFVTYRLINALQPGR
jgi:hypothetical protein